MANIKESEEFATCLCVINCAAGLFVGFVYYSE